MSRRSIFFIVFILSIFLLIILRGPVIRIVATNKLKRLEQNHSLLISYEKLKVKGLTSIKIDRLSIREKGRDTLFSADHLMLKFNLLKMMTFTPDLKQLDAENIFARFIKKDSVSNFDFIFKQNRHNKVQSDTLVDINPVSNVNYSKNADYLLSLVLRVLPSNVNIRNFKVGYFNGEYSLDISIPELNLYENHFSAVVISTENGKESKLHADGSLNDAERSIAARIYTDDGEKFAVPFLNFRWAAEARFDTLGFELTGAKRKNDIISFKGKALASGISIYHKRLSAQSVNLKKGSFEYKIILGKDYLELDSASIVKINDFSFSPYLKARKGNKWQLTASLNKQSFPADELFSSLPEGLFYNLEGIKTSGNLSYHFYFDIDFSNIDSLRFESLLKPEDFRIKAFGNTDFQKINSDFEYTAYEKGIPVRSFIVGPSNKNFRTLDKISPYLQMTVLQAEDGGFFYHKGFLPESMQEALALDLKEEKFQRGGSTISMQLVKNVFLSRNKTLARKFEEIMIVWLIETNHLSTKERMFEVYLNIIEWGPGVYGIGEASHFYFEKEPKDINVNEAIFLSEIIPAPKWALNSFDDDLHLKTSHEGYYRLLAQRLLIKGLISETEEAAVSPTVRIKGEAKRQIQNRQQKENKSL